MKPETNQIIALLNAHVSVRAFTGEAISDDDERTIVTTAQRSATSSNLQSYSIIGIRDQQRKDRLRELCGNQSHISQASLFLVFCADLYRLSRLADSRGYAFHGEYTESCLFATVDAALAADRALIAAQALGLGGVMVGAIRNNPDQVCELLALPPYTYPVMGMSLGRPAKQSPVKPRLPLEGIYHREQYAPQQLDAAVYSYDATIADGGHLSGRQVQPEQYPNFSGVYSWSEHSARRMADERAESLRPHMLAFLHSRGLMRR